MPDEPVETISLKQLRLQAAARQGDTDVVPMPKARTVALTQSANLVQIGPPGPGLGRRFAIELATVTLGRDALCSLPIADGSVSRLHAHIEARDTGGYRLSDLNSRNGSFVKGARVSRADLKDGDYVQLGECIFRFLAGGNIEAGYHDEIRRLTLLDPLTGVHNRRSLGEFLERELERAVRYSRSLAVLLIDADHFKQVNDRHGHAGGDAVLRGLAARLRNLARADDLVARYGGEEFAIALPETDLAAAVLTGDRYRRAVAAAPFDFESYAINLTVSVGVAAFEPGVPAVDLLQQADARLYEAKRTGRNRIVPVPMAEPALAATTETPAPLGATREIQL
jgi:two-component system, cell cycle response regulator